MPHANKLHETDNRFSRQRFSSGGLFVVGTDTEVGKTYIACKLAKLLVECGMRIGVYKPTLSGSDGREPNDAELLRAAANQTCEIERVCPQQFAAPVAPPIAAALEDREVDEGLLVTGANWWLGRCDLLIVEGAGGVLSPISNTQTVIDLAVEFAYPLLLVAADRLGAVNHTLLTIEAAQRRGLRIEAIILNRIVQRENSIANRQLIQQFAPRIPIFSDEELPNFILQ